LDGVLVEAKNIHYDALNLAISKFDKSCIIDWNEHLSKFDGLKTQQKLDMLTRDKGLSLDYHKPIWDEKQRITLNLLGSLEPNSELIQLFSSLSEKGYKIACCSNSIRKTVLTVLSKLGIIEFFDFIVSNENVLEVYFKNGSFA
jgi:beta-phosphoglucomutase-like phosphatase (HAD superfamily)